METVDRPAPDLSKGPVGENVVAGGEGDTGGQKEKICDSQVQNEQVGRVSHLMVSAHLEQEQKLNIEFASCCLFS